MSNTARQLQQKKEFLKPWMIDVCLQCRKRKTCESICRPCEIFINKNGRPALEKDIDDNHTRLYHHINETPISSLVPVDKDRFNHGDYLNDVFLCDADQEADDPALETTQTKLVYYHIIKRKSFADIAVRFGLKDAESARNSYNGAYQRLMEKLQAIEQRAKVVNHAATVIEKSRERMGEIPKNHRWWVLFCIMGLLPKEIAVMEGYLPDDKKAIKNIATEIGKVTRKLLDGDLVFLDPKRVKNQVGIRNKQLDHIREAISWLMAGKDQD